MLVFKENERLYPASYEYNLARVITKLATIVKDNGGKVKPLYSAIISNRSITHAIIEKSEKRDRAMTASEKESDPKKAAARVNYIERLDAEIEELKNINNEPITVTHTSYITFTMGDNYYYFSADSNFLFPAHIIKTPIINNKYSKDACLEESKKDWLFDSLLSWDCCNDDINESAYIIFNELCNAKNSVIRRDGRKMRVNNRYNSGYHYEMIYEPERIAKLDF